jgi:hypothetical protein
MASSGVGGGGGSSCSCASPTATATADGPPIGWGWWLMLIGSDRIGSGGGSSWPWRWRRLIGIGHNGDGLHRVHLAHTDGHRHRSVGVAHWAVDHRLYSYTLCLSCSTLHHTPLFFSPHHLCRHFASPLSLPTSKLQLQPHKS